MHYWVLPSTAEYPIFWKQDSSNLMCSAGFPCWQKRKQHKVTGSGSGWCPEHPGTINFISFRFQFERYLKVTWRNSERWTFHVEAHWTAVGGRRNATERRSALDARRPAKVARQVCHRSCHGGESLGEGWRTQKMPSCPSCPGEKMWKDVFIVLIWKRLSMKNGHW